MLTAADRTATALATSDSRSESPCGYCRRARSRAMQPVVLQAGL